MNKIHPIFFLVLVLALVVPVTGNIPSPEIEQLANLQADLAKGAPFEFIGSFAIGYPDVAGEREFIVIRPERIWYGSTDEYPKPQYLMRAVDIASEKPRTFAVVKVQHWPWEADIDPGPMPIGPLANRGLDP